MAPQPDALSVGRPLFSPGMRWIRRAALGIFLLGALFMIGAVFLRRSKKAALEQAIKECGYCCEERKGDVRPRTDTTPGRPSPGATP